MARIASKKTNNRRTLSKGQSRVTENPSLVGVNLYTDPKGRLVYIHPMTKKAVYIASYDEKKFVMYKRRYLIVLAALMLLYSLVTVMLEQPIWIPALLSLLLWIGLEYSFMKFLKTLQPVKKLKMEDLTPTYEAQISPEEKQKYWIRVGLYVLLGVLLVFNAYHEQYTGFTLAFCWAAGLFCAGCGVYQMWILSKFSKDRKKEK